MSTKNKKVSKQRYFGLVKVKKGIKKAWVAKEYEKGWGLGFKLGARIVWLTGLRFANEEEAVAAVGNGEVNFIYLKD